MEVFVGGTVLVGRDDEVRRLKDAVRQVAHHHGGAVWIDGEPGIGKSSLLDAGLSEAERLGCQVFRACADELARRWPLRAVLECLRVTSDSPDPKRRAIRELLSAPHADPVASATERLLTLVHGICTTAPAIVVLDDIQWADEASLLVWHQLARMTRDLPLLLVAAGSPAPRRAEIAKLRHGKAAEHASVIALKPLDAPATAEFAADLLDADATGPSLRLALEAAAGNPAYIREMVDVFSSGGHLTRSPDTAELTSEPSMLPESLAAAVSERLRFLSSDALESLRVGALLGPAFSAGDLSAVSGRPALELLAIVEEAVTCGFLLESGTRLEFRHSLVRRALLDGIPAALRPALHYQAARALATSGARIEHVAEQLLAALPGSDVLDDDWVTDWLVHNGRPLAQRTPEVAVDLLTSAAEAVNSANPRRDALRLALVGVLLMLGRLEDAQELAERILADTRDPATTAEANWYLARSLSGRRMDEQARTVVERAIAAPDVDSRWAARLRGLLAATSLSLGQVDAAETEASEALAAARRVGDRIALGVAMHATGLLSARRGDPAGAAADFDLALTELGSDPDMRLRVSADRIMALSAAGKPVDAEMTLREVLAGTERSPASPGLAAVRIAAATHYYYSGRWNDAVAELEAAMGLYDRLGTLQQSRLRGLAAVIAAHRYRRGTPEAQPVDASEKVDGTRFTVLASAMRSERDGRPGDAVMTLSAASASAEHMGNRYTWLPRLVRLALETGDGSTAAKATEMCEADAAAGTAPGMTAAAQHCRGLLEADPVKVEGAYRGLDLPPVHAQALEDAAVLFARRRDLGAARAAYVEATRIYAELGASWDLLRADARLRPHGMRRLRGRRANAATGWEALTPAELQVAWLVSDGHSNADIAARLFSSKRTVEAHVSRILAKLGVRSRVEIAIEATRHERPGEPGEPVPQQDRSCG
ncbi:putative ATPase [Saccharopolyspora erythraea NRRL 2338]|uniref:Transcriptional regulator, LuxR family n=3 Tax=Saccharopolyspora erythraea TaxID=1836 RepID=A4FKY7_SACEN|nr:AAA family ATPase [Saccharopolyspora erythraea]PFG98352.1 putative ATPase [Saccharopolyspora erythraea NRRL 2338]QRK88425.1 AAA family ATPase [Saccharopolyspora erythraea]CAM04712.1 transcriptional regulator, LuxR family [Saccharopolyspora erythraea NRRL 2338]